MNKASDVVPEPKGSKQSVPADAFRAGMRQLAAAVNVISTEHHGQRAGLTATAACSVSVDPPQLLVCVNKTGHAHSVIAEAGKFCVNVLALHQDDIAKRFAGMDGSDRSERFALGTWTTLETGAPVLEDCLANFDCEVMASFDAATHSIFVGRVIGIRAVNVGEPLLFGDGRFARMAELFDQ
jgi:flavin reductase (DIM6/NTAB) family NADH-FMN oxidoreductase RutF